MNRTLAGVFWGGLYLMVVLVPVFLMLVPPVPSGRTFWLELSIALGFVALTQIAVQFVLIARFKSVTAPYGIDVILQYHRQIAMVAVGAVMAHPLIIVLDNPSRLKLFNPLGGNWASRCAWVSVISLLAIVVTSVARKRLKLNYEWWRLLHLVLGVLAIVFAQLHASLAGLYKNTIWKQVVWVAMASVMVGLVLYLRVVRPRWQRNYRWKVSEVREEPGQTFALVLEAVGHRGMKFSPGQFAWLKLANTPFTLEEHPFSFASSSEQTQRIEFGIKALGDFSKRAGSIPPGTRAYLDGPHGAFSIDRYQAAAYVFIAGGVGITPIMSFLRTMSERQDQRPVLLFYANKTQDEIAYEEQIRELQASLNLDVVLVVEQPPAGWTGEQGFVDDAMLKRRLPKDQLARAFFVCGPPVMMEAARNALRANGVPQNQIQSESFNLV